MHSECQSVELGGAIALGADCSRQDPPGCHCASDDLDKLAKCGGNSEVLAAVSCLSS